MTRRSKLSFLFPLLVWSGCELVAAVDRDRIIDDGVAGAGGEPSCDLASCEGVTDCLAPTCEGDVCALAPEASGTSCSDGVCDGDGNCVECVGNEQCGDELCVEEQCVPENCVNGELDADETDIDCGGSCTPCNNGMACSEPTDCSSGFCDAGTCAACAATTDCADGQYCDDGGVCTDKQPLGEACSDGEQCETGFCPLADGVCCDTICNGLCESCLAAATSGSDGTCGALPDGTLCRPGSGDSCDPSETCSSGACPSDVVATSSTVCRAGSGDMCDPDELCTGTPGQACPAQVMLTASDVCRPKAGDCDIFEACPGVAGMACPADALVANHTEGNPECDENLLCNGIDADCPTKCFEDADCDNGTCNESSGKCQ